LPSGFGFEEHIHNVPRTTCPQVLGFRTSDRKAMSAKVLVQDAETKMLEQSTEEKDSKEPQYLSVVPGKDAFDMAAKLLLYDINEVGNAMQCRHWVRYPAGSLAF
jgi:hypothetical protein